MVADRRFARTNRFAQLARLEAARARERAARIERSTAWRRVSKELHESIKHAVQNTPSPLVVRIEHQSGDPEAHCYANDIGLALQEGGIQVLLMPNGYPHQSVYGVFLTSAPGFDATLIRKAFTEGGVPFGNILKDFTHLTMQIKGVPANLFIYVGMRPWHSSLEDAVDADDATAAHHPEAA